MNRPLAKLIASLLLSAAVLPALAAQPLHFSMRYLGDFAPTAMNNLGHVVGWGLSDDAHTAIVHDGTSGTFIGSPGGPSFAYGINDAGQIVGRTDRAAFIYSGGTFTEIGGPGSLASGINNAGQVTGATLADNTFHGFIYSNGQLTDLAPGNSSAGMGINSHGQVAGWIDALLPKPALFSNGTATDLSAALPSSIPSRASAINDNGQMLMQTSNMGDGAVTAFLYADGVATAMGRLGPFEEETLARDLNNAGIAVGNTINTRARTGFIWQDGALYDINTLVSGLSDWHIEEAVGINENNQIAAYACRGDFGDYQCGTLLLSAVAPVPEPSTYAMMVGGLGLLGFMARRRRATPTA